jgi:hypothetical protein
MASMESALSLVYAHVAAPEPIRQRLPSIGGTWQEALAARNPRRRVNSAKAEVGELRRYPDAQFERFLERIRPARRGQRPALDFLHSPIPHEPWRFGPSGKVYSASLNLAGLDRTSFKWSRNPDLVAGGYQRHMLQAMYADALLGRLLRRLRREGLYDRAAIVVSSDHGASFLPGGDRRHVDRSNVGGIGPVPLFIKASRQQRGRVVDKHIQTIDVLPTLADLIHLRVPWRVDGRSALRMPPGGRRRMTVSAGDGGEVQGPASFFDRARRRTLRRDLSLFPAGTRGFGLFGLGPYRRLAGKPLAAVRRLPAGGLHAVVDELGEYRKVQPRSRFVPALVSGRIEGDGTARSIAIAVNGRIAGVGPSYVKHGRRRFSIPIPARALRAGANRVRVYAVSNADGLAALTPLGS